MYKVAIIHDLTDHKTIESLLNSSLTSSIPSLAIDAAIFQTNSVDRTPDTQMAEEGDGDGENQILRV